METVLNEAKKVVVAIVGLDVLYLLILLLGGWYDRASLIGIIYGSICFMTSFMLLGYAVSKAVNSTPGRAQVGMVIHYLVRFALIAFLIFIGIVTAELPALPVVMPFLFGQIAIFLSGIIQKSSRGKS